MQNTKQYDSVFNFFMIIKYVFCLLLSCDWQVCVSSSGIVVSVCSPWCESRAIDPACGCGERVGHRARSWHWCQLNDAIRRFSCQDQSLVNASMRNTHVACAKGYTYCWVKGCERDCMWQRKRKLNYLHFWPLTSDQTASWSCVWALGDRCSSTSPMWTRRNLIW